MWSHMMVLGVPVVEKILRAIIIYFFLIVGLRLAGKRELAQLNPFDLVVLLTLSNTVQNAIIGDDNSLIGGIIGATALLLINYIFVRFLFSHPRLGRVVEGSPVALMERGKVQESRLKREFITIAELRSAARRQGFDSLTEVDRAVLESGGIISFQRKEPSPEVGRYQELLGRLDQLTAELNGVRAAVERLGPTP
jgi:uncharacterized membrane protein YcaP (DUF421 family)